MYVCLIVLFDVAVRLHNICADNVQIFFLTIIHVGSR